MLLETIFKHLLEDDEYYNKVYPHLYENLFAENKYKILFNKVKYFSDIYSKKPTITDKMIQIVL